MPFVQETVILLRPLSQANKGYVLLVQSFNLKLV
jgi:hypothetical protein